MTVEEVFRASFNSRPHEEVDLHSVLLFLIIYSFNSRPHEEVDTEWRFGSIQALVFQFTTSRGGRQGLWGYWLSLWSLSIHDLTRRSTQCVGGKCR